MTADTARSPEAQQLRADGVTVTSHPELMSLRERIWRRIVPSSFTPAARNGFTSIISNVRPDLVVVSSGGLFPGPNAAMALMEAEIPYVNLANAAHVDWAPDDQLAALLREYASRSSAMFFVSEQNRRDCETQLSVRLQNAHSARNPYLVGSDINLPWPVDDCGQTLKMACVGRLYYPAKGQDMLIEALARTPWNNRSWHLSFFGTGPHNVTIRRLAQMHDIADRLSFHGHVSDIEAVWRNHHVLVLPSRYEGLPIALVEAMLCGRPVLAGDVGGARELVDEGKTGFLCQQNSDYALSDALERLWAARGSLEALGISARTRARDFVSPDPVDDFINKLSRVTGLGL